MIGIDTENCKSNEETRAAIKENRRGKWTFTITHRRGALLPDAQHLYFEKSGSYTEASAEAASTALNYGCVDGQDDVLLIGWESMPICMPKQAS